MPPLAAWERNDILAALDQHIPSLTDDDDQKISERHAAFAWGEDNDNAVLALRTCRCDKKIDGFYEYVDHLKEVIRAL